MSVYTVEGYILCAIKGGICTSFFRRVAQEWNCHKCMHFWSQQSKSNKHEFAIKWRRTPRPGGNCWHTHKYKLPLPKCKFPLFCRFFGCTPIDGIVAEPRHQGEAVGPQKRWYQARFGRPEKSWHSKLLGGYWSWIPQTFLWRGEICMSHVCFASIKKLFWDS